MRTAETQQQYEFGGSSMMRTADTEHHYEHSSLNTEDQYFDFSSPYGSVDNGYDYDEIMSEAAKAATSHDSDGDADCASAGDMLSAESAESHSGYSGSSESEAEGSSRKRSKSAAFSADDGHTVTHGNSSLSTESIRPALVKTQKKKRPKQTLAKLLAELRANHVEVDQPVDIEPPAILAPQGVTVPAQALIDGTAAAVAVPAHRGADTPLLDGAAEHETDYTADTSRQQDDLCSAASHHDPASLAKLVQALIDLNVSEHKMDKFLKQVHDVSSTLDFKQLPTTAKALQAQAKQFIATQSGSELTGLIGFDVDLNELGFTGMGLPASSTFYMVDLRQAFSNVLRTVSSDQLALRYERLTDDQGNR
jgi:hypothetical protein